MDSPLQHPLEQLARQVCTHLPNLQQMAHDAACKVLAEQGISADPESIFWHRFHTAESSSRSYTGFVHHGTPLESMTFTQLLIQRFHVSDQDAADSLSVMGGFYHAPANAGIFDERNEVRLLPQAVLPAFWAVDFATTYRAALEHFWAVDADALRTLIRITGLAAGAAAHRDGQLAVEHLQVLFDGFGVAQPMALRLADLSGPRPALHGSSVTRLCLGGVELVSGLLFALPDGQCLLYLAGREQPLQAFATAQALQAWLYKQVCGSSTRLALLNHCPVLEAEAAKAREQLFKRLGEQPLAAFQACVEQRPVLGDAAGWLRDQLRVQMDEQARLSLHSNAQLRKQLWIGYLSAGLRLFAPMAPLAWPVMLLAVVGGISSLGLNIDQAVNGQTAAERRAGLLGSVLAGIGVLLDLALAIPMAWGSLRGLESFQARPTLAIEAPALADGHGVLALDDGQYIRMDGTFYRVRHDAQLNCWLIVDPQRPFAFHGNFPVRLNSELQWEALPAPCLRGGGLCISRPQLAVAEDAPTVPALAAFEVSPEAREATRQLLGSTYRRMLSGDYYDPASPLNPACENFQRLRAALLQKVQQFFEDLPGIPQRSNLHAPDPQQPAIQALTRLLAESRGAVIGETHAAIGSKRFLIDNMRELARSGVDTLYLEHLLRDLHQLDLDLFARSGKLTGSLSEYLAELDAGQLTDPSGRYTFTRLVKVAGEQRIRLRCLDCAASYRLDGLGGQGSQLRQRVFSYYAGQVLRARPAGAGRWLALVGNTHVSTYKGVPGLAQLSDVTGIRIVDAGAGQATQMTLDPGEYFPPSLGRPGGIVRADWRLAVQTRERPYAYLDPSQAPAGLVQR